MPPRKQLSTGPASTQASSDQVERLTEAVERLAGELSSIREILDRMQDDFAWALSNDRFRRRPRPSATPVTSMALDPLAPDFAERLNAVAPPEPPTSANTHDDSETPHQADLFA